MFTTTLNASWWLRDSAKQWLRGGANHGADHYRRMSQASRKGMAFDDCLTRARQFSLASCTKEEKPEKAGKKAKSRTVAAARQSLI